MSQSPSDAPVLMIVGGGLEHGGGIGRMVGYAVAAWNRDGRPPMRVIDTRGPQFRRVLWPLFLLRSLGQLVRAAPQRPIIHIHLAANTSTVRKLLVAAMARLLGLKYLIHLHDPKFDLYYRRLPRWMQGLVRAMYGKAAAVLVLGTPAARMVSELLDVPRERIDIIPNAVPGPTELLDAGSKPAGEPPHILFLGQLQQRKGVHDLIDALARPEVATRPWICTLAGGGPDQPAYEQQAARLGIGDRVRFPGWVAAPAVRELLQGADMLVLPSYAEEMAMSLLEGMAYGLCIVCTPVGAQAEVIEDEVSALSVAPGDVAGLAAALARCVADPALRQRIGAGARATFRRGYDIADYPKRIAAIYRRRLDGEPRSAVGQMPEERGR